MNVTITQGVCAHTRRQIERRTDHPVPDGLDDRSLLIVRLNGAPVIITGADGQLVWVAPTVDQETAEAAVTTVKAALHLHDMDVVHPF